MKLAKFSTKFSKKQIFLLSIPVFFSNLAIPLVGIVDTGLMGNLGETKYLAATSIATSVMTMVIWSFGFSKIHLDQTQFINGIKKETQYKK